jgi:hypothetical protein
MNTPNRARLLIRDADGRSERGGFGRQDNRTFHRASARTSDESAYPGTHSSGLRQ